MLTSSDELVKERRLGKSLQLHLPQHLLLYAALFCSLMAFVFSIQTHLSTDFVSLSEPLDAGIFYKNVTTIGLSSWELCGLKKNIISEIQFGSIDSALGVYAPKTGLKDLYPSRSNVKSTPIMIKDELEMDDGLASADFPYRDDDEILNRLPLRFWSCQAIHLSSYELDDTKWILSLVFFMIGSILGVTASCFLIVLIVLRSRRVVDNVKKGRWQQNYKENRHIELQFRSLDTTSTGYRQVASLFLITYLFQCITFIFLDSDTCKRHDCHISSGAYSLLAACILWVVSGVLVYLMMRKVWNNQKLVRAYKKSKKTTGTDIPQMTNSDASTLEKEECSENSSPSNSKTGFNDMDSLGATFDSNEIIHSIDLEQRIHSHSSSSFDSHSQTNYLGTHNTSNSTQTRNINRCPNISYHGRSLKPDQMFLSHCICEVRKPNPANLREKQDATAETDVYD